MIINDTICQYDVHQTHRHARTSGYPPASHFKQLRHHGISRSTASRVISSYLAPIVKTRPPHSDQCIGLPPGRRACRTG
eukprot:scaffold37752_cov35-Prasinocladus_malaysianus.AAC.1